MSGISVPKEVQLLFAQTRQESQVRWLKLVINDGDSIECAGTGDMTSSFENDLNSVAEDATSGRPAYYLFRMDEKNQFGNQWLVIMFVPDTCKPKPKMLYSSTIERVKKDLGGTYFAGDYHASKVDELRFENFAWESKEVKMKLREESMSHQEKLKAEEKQESCSFDTSQSSAIRGVAFPVSDALERAMNDIVSGKTECVTIVVADEKFDVDYNGTCSIDDVVSKINGSLPRFTFWTYNHNFEDKDLSSIFFIYSCPTSSKVKERMVYSSSKASIVNYALSKGIVIEQTLETSDVADLTSSFLHNYIHPPKEVETVYKKPSRPGRPATKK